MSGKKGGSSADAARVSTFGFTAGPQLITALFERRGYGEARGEGLFSWCKISECLTHPACGIPPLPQAGEGCCQLIFRRQTKMYSSKLACGEQGRQLRCRRWSFPHFALP